MKMKKIYRLCIIACFTILMSCTNIVQQPGDNQIQQVQRISIVTHEDAPCIEDFVKPGQYANYTNYFKSADAVIGFSSSKASPLDAPLKRYCFKSVDSDHIMSKQMVKVNGLDFTQLEQTKSSGIDNSFFGTKLSFSFLNNGTKSDLSEPVDVNLYSPQEIVILKPEIKKEDELLPLCYYDGFKIVWNSDPNNKNGVIFVVEWVGEKIIGKDVPDTYIRRTCVFEDNGQAVLNPSIFEGIPDTAVCHLTIARGDIEVAEIDGVSYKVLAESHEFMTFVLIRNIKKK